MRFLRKSEKDFRGLLESFRVAQEIIELKKKLNGTACLVADWHHELLSNFDSTLLRHSRVPNLLPDFAALLAFSRV
jgi:hypothetical protein